MQQHKRNTNMGKEKQKKENKPFVVNSQEALKSITSLSSWLGFSRIEVPLSLYVKVTDGLGTRTLKQNQASCSVWNRVQQSWACGPHTKFSF